MFNKSIIVTPWILWNENRLRFICKQFISNSKKKIDFKEHLIKNLTSLQAWRYVWSYSAWAFYPLILSQPPIQLYLPLMYLSRINMPILLCLYPTCLEQIIFIGNSSHSPTHLSYYEFKQWLYWNLQKPFCEIFLFL